MSFPSILPTYLSLLLTDGTPDEWRGMLDVNVVALCLLTKLVVNDLRQRGIDEGHVIHISRWVL